jgi:flavin reductase (DIM6/NTAB) family NADH-FMN oxidoreductase RutF
MMVYQHEYTVGLDQTAFRQVVGHFMSGVTVITTYDGTRFGVTASAVSSLSLDPPMLLVCLNQRLATTDAIGRAGHFAVNVLSEEHAKLATQFATPNSDKFFGVAVTDSGHGVPLLSAALAQIECEVEMTVQAATHTIFLGRVLAARARHGRPLAYFRGSFGALAGATA